MPKADFFRLGAFPQGGIYRNSENAISHPLGLFENTAVLHPELTVDYGFTFAVHENLVRDPLPVIFVSVHADRMKAVREQLLLRYDDQGDVVVAAEEHPGA